MKVCTVHRGYLSISIKHVDGSDLILKFLSFVLFLFLFYFIYFSNFILDFMLGIFFCDFLPFWR